MIICVRCGKPIVVILGEPYAAAAGGGFLCELCCKALLEEAE